MYVFITTKGVTLSISNIMYTYFSHVQGSKDSTGTEDEDTSSEEEGETGDVESTPIPQGESATKIPQAKETEAGAEISALVNYVQPVHFSSFENAQSM